MDSQNIQNVPDPLVHKHLRYFCDLFPNQRWIDTFLMYNRRIRTVGDYEGDLIPPRLIARMKKMTKLFDYLIILTPYHDVAGKDWTDLNWLRSIDPYVVGFSQGVPLIFVLGRFSDSGIFPLYSELIADTIDFLRKNFNKLEGFNKVNNPYWYNPGASRSFTLLGTRLIDHTKELLKAFDKGILFDWLRGQELD